MIQSQKQRAGFNPHCVLEVVSQVGGTRRLSDRCLALWRPVSFLQKVTSCLAPVRCTLPQHIRGLGLPEAGSSTTHTHTQVHTRTLCSLWASRCGGGQGLACHRRSASEGGEHEVGRENGESSPRPITSRGLLLEKVTAFFLPARHICVPRAAPSFPSVTHKPRCEV